MDELTKLKIRNAELEAALAANQHALESSRQEILRREQEIEALHEFDKELTKSEDLEFILNHVLSWVKVRTHADYGLVARWDENRQVFEVLMARGIALGVDYQKGELFQLPNHLRPPEVTERDPTGILFDSSQTYLVSELRLAEGQLIGVLVVQRHSGIKFTSSEKKFTRIIADRLTISLHMSTLLKRVQDMNQHRGQLFRMLSHDLRQPLTVLMGYLQLMEYAIKNNKPEMAVTYVNHISTGAKDLHSLLEEVLLMERVANLSSTDWNVVSLLDISRQALEKHQAAADLQDHQVILELPEGEAYCKGLELELKEAAGNLINNAIKYTPKGGTITIRLLRHEDFWQFEVQDTGYGIDRERQARLFQSFYRAQQPGTENIKGTGLGLNLVKSIVEKHNGKIFFESEPGKGSRFGFWLPASEAKE